MLRPYWMCLINFMRCRISAFERFHGDEGGWAYNTKHTYTSRDPMLDILAHNLRNSASGALLYVYISRQMRCWLWSRRSLSEQICICGSGVHWTALPPCHCICPLCYLFVYNMKLPFRLLALGQTDYISLTKSRVPNRNVKRNASILTADLM